MAGRRSFGPWHVAIVVLVAGAVLCLVMAMNQPGEPPQQPAPQKQPALPAAGPAPVLKAPAVAQPAEPPQPQMLRYPDGSQHPPLNGVTDPPSIDWPPDVPFAPVVGKVTDGQGIEWYRHADGSLTTVQMIWRSDLGRKDAMARIVNPTTPVRVEHDPPADATRKRG